MHKIAVVGQQCSGKTSAAKYISGRHFGETIILKHAQPIYDVLAILGKAKHRAFMQGFGTLAKEHFGKLVFLQLFAMEIGALEAESHYDLIMNDDTRFPFEMDLLKELGFKVIYIDAPRVIREGRANALGLEYLENHESELFVPQLEDSADYVIHDDGITMKELYHECNVIVNSIYREEA